MRLIVLSLLLSAISAAPLMAAEPAPSAQAAAATPLVIGETFTIESKALGETRRINVYRPQPWAWTRRHHCRCCTCPTAASAKTSCMWPGLCRY
ncbi:hypothetical protein NMB32_23755 [Stenotrophomonas sp. CD2]|nr:hypothetical protein NMB32_23755 [Stenotrophomonas sp. CD2]